MVTCVFTAVSLEMGSQAFPIRLLWVPPRCAPAHRGPAARTPRRAPPDGPGAPWAGPPWIRGTERSSISGVLQPARKRVEAAIQHQADAADQQDGGHHLRQAQGVPRVPHEEADAG